VNLLGSRSIINLINAQSIKGEMSDETIVTLNRSGTPPRTWR
jgi:HD-like signal output (HDOD) protein